MKLIFNKRSYIVKMEKDEFFKIYNQIKNKKFKDLSKLDFNLLHKINTMLLYEIELRKSHK